MSAGAPWPRAAADVRLAVRSLAGKTLFITGASRGIGLAIALRAARDGANVVVAAKTTDPHPRLPGTIHTAAAQLEAAGGRALPLAVDIRFEEQVRSAVGQAVERFGGIDILVNNASAISLTGTLETSMKRFDLMMGVNVRGTFLCSQACIPYLAKASNPHILTLCPPPELRPEWLAPHLAYTISKFGMSLCVMGLAAELRSAGIAVNALWPRTIIATAALNVIAGAATSAARTPQIVADAAHWILTGDSRGMTGRFLLDEAVLAESGCTDLSGYAVKPGEPLREDLFVSS